MTKIKKSYGLICCRKHPTKGLQIILIKKPTTYHFCEFVSGHYRRNDNTHLHKLFANMTYHEKMDILSMKFANMWYRVYKSQPDQAFLQNSSNFLTKQYIRKKNKFEVAFLHDGGQRLKKLISDSINVETIWEIPKGKRRETKEEADIDAAIREFTEETLIQSDHYRFLWRVKPYIETYADFGVTYQNIFYYAEAIGEWEPSIKFGNNQQISEVSAIRWCSKNDLNNMALEKTTYRRLINMFNKVGKKWKNYTLRKSNNYTLKKSDIN
jgi:8-oxo-dGTP pyrophosphatase MutT (NUDIX family)